MNLEINNREKEILKNTLMRSFTKLDDTYNKQFLTKDISIKFLEERFGSLDELDLLLNKLI